MPHLAPAQVFKAARALAPSVVLLEDAEQVFVSDKTRAAALAPPGGEPPNRIKKQLLAEVRRRAGRGAGLGGGVWRAWVVVCGVEWGHTSCRARCVRVHSRSVS